MASVVAPMWSRSGQVLPNGRDTVGSGPNSTHGAIVAPVCRDIARHDTTE